MATSLAILALVGGIVVGVGALVRFGGEPRAPAPAPRMAAAARMERVFGCTPAPALSGAAAANAASLTTTAWRPFGRDQGGWEIYLPQVQREIDTGCPADSEAFARALMDWQAGRRLAATGTMDEASFEAMRVTWLRRRPFVAATAGGACPPPPDPSALATAAPSEGYSGKTIQLRTGALEAYRRMVAAARAEEPAFAADPRVLTIFSGYRDPVADGLRCDATGDCGTLAHARCSAHRTGLAVDLYLGSAPGFPPESSDDVNRRWESKTPAYRWLVRNADRFGFVPYPFEPWHWEWTGEPP